MTQNYPERWIAQNGPTLWPPRSSDLNKYDTDKFGRITNWTSRSSWCPNAGRSGSFLKGSCINGAEGTKGMVKVKMLCTFFRHNSASVSNILCGIIVFVVAFYHFPFICSSLASTTVRNEVNFEFLNSQFQPVQPLQISWWFTA
jgi:hypothetical protein